MNNYNILVEKLLNNGFDYITHVTDNSITYTIRDIKYYLIYMKAMYREEKPFQMKPFEGCMMPWIDVSTNGEPLFRIIIDNEKGYYVKFTDRVQMATFVDIMESQIIAYRDKLYNNAIEALNEKSNHF